MNAAYIEEFAFAKLNLNFKIINKLKNNYHQIDSYITFLPCLYDYLTIKKDFENHITFSGRFSKELENNGGDTLIRDSIKLLSNLLKINIRVKIHLKKNIPLGSGLGGGSADAAAVIRAIMKLYKINNNKSLIINNLSKIGADIPTCFISKNVKVEGFGNIVKPLKSLNKNLWVLLIKPKSSYSTKYIFENFNNKYAKPSIFKFTVDNLIKDMNEHNNSLQRTVCKVEKNVEDVIAYLSNYESLTLPRITGSGSVVFVLFNTEKDLNIYKKNLDLNKKDYWIKTSIINL